jgi:cell division initiation protein
MMITAQDIREKTFEKSKFGGYDMAQVDEFLEELADDLTNSQKEVAVLKSKMKVLVDKIEEYRNNESALNKSILSAQKLAQEIETEARDKAAKVLADAEKKADETVGSITARAEFEEKLLAAAEAATAKFFDGIRAMCNAQLRNLDNLRASTFSPQPAPRAAEPAPAAEVYEDASADLDLPESSAPDFADGEVDATQAFTL